jgi:hypothetical protein
VATLERCAERVLTADSLAAVFAGLAWRGQAMPGMRRAPCSGRHRLNSGQLDAI